MRERARICLVGLEGFFKEGTYELGFERWKGSGYMKIWGKSVLSRIVNEKVLR